MIARCCEHYACAEGCPHGHTGQNWKTHNAHAPRSIPSAAQSQPNFVIDISGHFVQASPREHCPSPFNSLAVLPDAGYPFRMVKLKSRQQCAVDGFQFIDAAISPDPLKTWDFEQLCREIQARRLNNPRFQLPTDLAVIREEVDQQNALRMLSIRGADSYIMDTGGNLPNPPRPAHTPKWGGAAGALSRLTSGTMVLKDWLGAGGVPVAKELAAARAAVCATCPKKVPGDWTTLFTQPIADRIKAQIEMKQQMELTTPSDAELKGTMCEACSCPLELKIFTPLEHVLAHQSADTKSRLDARCWILKNG